MHRIATRRQGGGRGSSGTLCAWLSLLKRRRRLLQRLLRRAAGIDLSPVQRAEIVRFLRARHRGVGVGGIRHAGALPYFEVVLERIGRPPRSDLLVIGDSLTSDIAGGVASGIDTCWFNPHAWPPGDGPAPTYEIRRLSELLPIVGS